MEDFGLQNGDVVHDIHGHTGPPTEPALAAIYALGSGRLGVRRGGEDAEITVNLRRHTW
jgi:phenylalanine-4-hydroxylase